MQDFEAVGGASGREGLQRTAPRWEKWERPLRAVSGVPLVSCAVGVVGDGEDTNGTGEVHGVASS